jgi:hypothetical protein
MREGTEGLRDEGTEGSDEGGVTKSLSHEVTK